MVKNHLKLSTGLVLCIIFIPVLSTSIIIPENESYEIQTTLLQSLRGEEFISNPKLPVNGKNANKLPESSSSSDVNNVNQISPINSKVEEAGIPVEDYVDYPSNVDFSSDLGSHNTFTDLYTTDSTYDNISEVEAFSAINTTLIDAQSFEGVWLPSGWSETTGSLWDKSSSQYYDGIYSAEFDSNYGGQSGNLDSPALNTSDANAIFIEFRWYDYRFDSNEFLLQLYNGNSWITYQNMESLPHSESVWEFYSVQITDTQYFLSDFQIRWRANNIDNGEAVYIDSVTIKKKTMGGPSLGFQLDLETQFSGVYNSPLIIEELCIRTGSFRGTENLNITYWDGNTWELITSALTPSTWNNYTVSLTSPTFTIKFGGATTSSDSTQDWWEIDSVLLKVESPEEVFGNDSGFIWLDSPDEVDLGVTYNSWVQQDLSDDNVPNYATSVIVAWVEDGTANGHAVARGSQDTNDYMNGGAIYNEFEAETWRMQVVKLSEQKYIDTWRESAFERLYIMGYTVGVDPQFKRVAADLGALTANSSWNTITVTGVDDATTGVILFGQSTSGQDAMIMVRAVGSADSMTAREWEQYNSGAFFVKLDANDQFEYAITSGGSAKFYLIAEVKDSIEWLDTNRDSISATVTGWSIRDLDSYVSVPSTTSGVILQLESTGEFSDYRNIAKEYGQTWTLPDYDVGGDQWMIGGSGIDSENRIQIYAENLEQDVYIHALTHFFDNTPPKINSFGIDDPGTGTATFWVNLMDNSEIDNVTLSVNGPEYQMSDNGSYWIKDLPVNWQEFYSYQITNASDVFGNFLTTASNVQNYTFSYDTIVPTVIDWEYYQGPDGTWDNQNNTFIANVSDSWGEIDNVILEVTTYSYNATMREYRDFGSFLSFINDTLDLPNGGINFRIIVNDTKGNELTSSLHSGSVFYNNPPTASNLTLSNAPYYSNSSLILDYTYWDEDSHPESGTEICWYRNGILQGNHNDTLEITANFLFTGDEWYATVKPKDNALFGQLNASLTITVINTPPTIPNVEIVPINPLTSSTLVIDYEYYDYEGSSENGSYRQIEWYRVGTGHLSAFDNQTSLSSVNTIEGEEYYIRIRVYDGGTYSIWHTSAIVVIGNSIPEAVYLSLPVNPSNVTDLVATWDMQDDDIGDIENTTVAIIFWYKNGDLQPDWTNLTIIGSRNTSKGQIWWFKIQVFDGEQYSTLTELLPHVEILNSVPVVSNVSITPISPYTVDDLALGNWNFSDADNDVEGTPFIRWYRDDLLQSGYNGYTTLPASATSKGEYWHVSIQVNDGSVYSLKVNTSKILILNASPDVDNLTLTTTPTTTNNLVASWTYTDVDLDSLTYNVTWYLNNEFNSRWVTNTNSATLNAGNTTKYQLWYYTVQAFDGEAYSTLISLGSNVTIQNSNPTVTNPTFTNTNPTPSDDFNITYVFVDADGDQEDSNELIVYWYIDWVYQSQYQNYTSISSQNTSSFEVWYYILRVCDGEDYSSNITSETGIIIGSGSSNLKPTAENLTLTPFTPLTSDDLIAYYDYSDPENNSQIAFEISWYMNDTLQPEYQTLIIPASATVKNQQWNFTIRVFDGLQWSDLKSSLVLTIGNTAPEVIGIEACSTPTTIDNLVVSWSSSDNDSDPLSFNVTWISNGVINSSWWTNDHFAILNAGNTTKGDNWNVTIKAYDGDGGYSSIFTLGANITIINTTPLAENLTLTPFPQTEDNLTANWNFFDIDNDLENTGEAIIYWYKNGGLQPSWTNSTMIGSGNTSKGQVWWFKVQVFDNQNYSILYELFPHIEIQNTAPINSSALPIPVEPSVENEIVLSLSSILFSFNDADGDTVELVKLRWYKNGILQVNLNDSLTISGSKLTKGENWTYSVLVYDSVYFSSQSFSAEFQILNSQPTISSVNFAKTIDVRTVHNLTITYQASDVDDDPIYNAEIYWYRFNGTDWDYMPAYDGNLSLPYTATTKGEIWRFNISVTDLTAVSDWKVPVMHIEIENSLPWINPYSITLTGGLDTSDPITVSYLCFDDDAGDSESGTTIAWENSTWIKILDNSLEPSYTTAGESWSVSITPNDGTDFGQPINSKFYGINVIIGNTPPEITGNEIIIQGYDPINDSYSNEITFGTNLDLVVRYNVTDIDGLQGVAAYDVFLVDGYAYGSTYHWFRNRSCVVTLITALNGMTNVPSTFTERGDLWWIEVTPRDLYGDFGSAKNSTQISITNTPPYLASLSWSKTSFYTSDDLTFEYIFADHDLSDVEFGSIIEWYRNGVNQSNLYTFVSISFLNTTKGEIWFARIKVWDSDLYSSWYTLTNITILNTAPVVSDILLTPTSPITTQELVVSWSYFDFDNDSQQSPRIYWYRNNILQSGLNDSIVVNSSYLSKSYFWFATIEVYDGEDYSVVISSLSVTILNSPLTLIDVVIWNNIDLSNTSYSDGSISSYSLDYTDNDDDLIDAGATSIQWYRNGIHIPIFNNQTGIQSSELNKGDSWYAIFQVLDIGGTVWSNSFTSQTILVINKAPNIIEFIYVGTEYPGFVVEDESINISLTLFDPDVNDTDSSYLEWYLTGVYQPQFDYVKIIESDATTPGDIWLARVTPSDGIDNGTVAQLQILIESRPYIQNFTTVIEQDIDGHFTFSLKVNDSRNDVVSVIYEIYLNGTELDVIDTIFTANATGHWIFDYYLTDPSYYFAQAMIVVTTESEIGISSIRFYNIVLIDGVAPRVSDEGLGVWFVKNSNDPTELSFFADIEEYGSGVANVTLYYYYNLIGDGGEGSALNQDFTQILMSFNSSADGKLTYAVTVSYPLDGEDYEILYYVSTQDLNGNSNPVAFDIRNDADRIRNEQIIHPTEGLPEWVLYVAGLAVLLIFVSSVVYVRFIRKPELVGLDKEQVLKNIDKISETDISANLEETSIGIIVSFFDQRQGPIPIIVFPEVLKDNFTELINISDRSFNNCGFATNFEREIGSSFNYELTDTLTIHSMSFGFALNRPSSRGGQENITLNILLHEDSYSILNHFQVEIQARVHNIHKLMDEQGDQKDEIRKHIFNLRRFVSSIVLAYQEIYGMEPPVMEQPEIIGFEV